MAFEELSYQLLGVKHYVIKRYKGNVLISTKRMKIAGQNFFIDTKRRLAYLLPPETRCFIDGNKYDVLFDLNEATPMNDLKDVINPELFKNIMNEMKIPAEHYKFIFWSKKYTLAEIETEKAKWKLVPPIPIERVGIRPDLFMEWLEANTTGEILRKTPEKFAWLREVFMVAIIGIMVVLVTGFLTGSLRIGG